MASRIANQKLTRRTLLKTGAAAGTMSLAAPYVSNPAMAADILYINTWGGAWEEAAREFLFDPFTADTGVEIRTVSPVSLAKLDAQVRSGVYEFDVTTLGVAPLAQANNADLIEQTDGVVSDADFFPGAISANGIASHAFGNAIVYRTDVFGDNGPSSWAEFWDVEKFPGDRSLQNYAARVIGMALMADGVSKNALFPYDLDRAFASLDRIKPHVVTWWTQGPQSVQLLRDGEVSALGMWPNFQLQTGAEDIPGKVEWNECLVDTAYWVVAKGTPRAEMAWEFVKSSIKAERVGPFAAHSGSGPVNPAALEFVSGDLMEILPTAPQYKDKVVFLQADGIAGQLEEMEERFAEWLLQ